MSRKTSAVLCACVILGLIAFLGECVFTRVSRGDVTSGWARQESGTQASLESVTATDANNVWAVGGTTYPSGSFIILHSSDGGQTWATQKSAAGNSLTDVCAVDANVLWTVAGEPAYSLHNGNQSRVIEASPNAILKTTNGGADWTAQDPGVDMQVNGVSAVDANTAWVVGTGADGIILKTTNGGTNWNPQPVPVSCSIRSVSAVDASTAFAVGSRTDEPGSIILKTVDGGASWVAQYPDTSWSNGNATLNSISAFDADNAWAVGGWGTVIVHTSDGGATWQKQFESYWPLWDVVAIDARTAWTVGGGLTIMKTTDSGWNWMLQDPGVPYEGWGLWGIAAAGREKAWAVGGGGVILHTTIGGGYDFNWYFAEGCTREGFREWLSIQNSNPKEIQVHAQYMLFGGAPLERTYTIAANSRLSVNVNTEVGDGQDVAVRLMGTDEFFAERPIYCDYKQDVPGYGWSGGHDTMGARAPKSDWYFAEGCTREGFEEWICVQNPNQSQASVKVDYVSAGAPTVRKEYTVEANSRTSVFVNGDMGPGQDVSAHVFTDGAPIVAERVMYFNYQAGKNPGMWDDGAVVMGVDFPKTEWYFAEGCTRAGFEEWLCVQNPNSAAAVLTVTYDITGEAPVTKGYSVPANSRGTLDVNAEVGPDKDVSVHVVSSEPVICERPLYFNYTGRGAPGWNGGSAEMGVNSPAPDWYFAEGYTGDGFHEWICIQNTGAVAADVTVTYNIEGAAPVVKNHTVPPGRYTIFVNEDAGTNLNVSAHIHSSAPVICERSMYFDYTGWNGGHCAKGYAP